VSGLPQAVLSCKLEVRQRATATQTTHH
jgi:hypothetical protein